MGRGGGEGGGGGMPRTPIQISSFFSLAFPDSEYCDTEEIKVPKCVGQITCVITVLAIIHCCLCHNTKQERTLCKTIFHIC